MAEIDKSIFVKGNKITTNQLNCFVVIDTNDYQVCCQDLLTLDFCVFTQTEHSFKLFDNKIVLRNVLKEILIDYCEDTKTIDAVTKAFDLRLNAWL